MSGFGGIGGVVTVFATVVDVPSARVLVTVLGVTPAITIFDISSPPTVTAASAEENFVLIMNLSLECLLMVELLLINNVVILRVCS